MLIQCTKKLLDNLNIKPVVVTDGEPLFSWHANLVTINRRKAVVLVNDSNRYTVVIYGLKAKDFKNPGQIIISAIRETLLKEYIKPEVVEKYINHSPDVVYAKTKDRSTVAKLNNACDNVSFYANVLRSDSFIQSAVGVKVNALRPHDRTDGLVYPYESMYKELEAFSGEPVFSCKAVELKITLDLENHNIWRRVITPFAITFKQLHDTIQVLFDWKDYHLHDFTFADGNKPVVNLVCDEEAFKYQGEIPMRMETDIMLSEYIPKYNRIEYRYDFGDNWEHIIEVERIVENYPRNYPVCMGGEGNAPPEDVGGEGGYDEFLEVINDPDHPEHDSMMRWAKMQWYRDFDIKHVNRRLVNSLKGVWER